VSPTSSRCVKDSIKTPRYEDILQYAAYNLPFFFIVSRPEDVTRYGRKVTGEGMSRRGVHTHAWHTTAVLYSPGFLLMLILFLNTTYDYIMRDTHNFCALENEPERCYSTCMTAPCLCLHHTPDTYLTARYRKIRPGFLITATEGKLVIPREAENLKMSRYVRCTTGHRYTDDFLDAKSWYTETRLSKCMINDDDSIMIIIL